MKFYLIVSKGKHRGMPIPIHVDLFLIGTDKACQLRAQHPDMGGQQCAMVVRGKKVFIRDLGSGKKTTVNGEEVPGSEEWPIHKNDIVAAGPLEFRVSFHEKQLSQRDLEEWALKTLDDDTGPKSSAFEEFDSAMNKAEEDHDDAAAAAGAILGKASALKGVVRGRLRISREGPITIVRINDVYMVEEAELLHIKKELQDNLNIPNLKVLLDMKNVRRMSSAAMSLFTDVSGFLKKNGGRMALCRLRPELAGMVDDLRNVFQLKVFDDKPQAMKGKW